MAIYYCISCGDECEAIWDGDNYLSSCCDDDITDEPNGEPLSSEDIYDDIVSEYGDMLDHNRRETEEGYD